MPYLIDGHNLMRQCADLPLDDPRSAIELALRLQRFSGGGRKQIVVYYDGGQFGEADPPPRAGVTLRFVRKPREADDAIGDHLRRLGKTAPNWTVVSSDHKVQAAARQARARVIDSRSFARLLESVPGSSSANAKPESTLSPEEIDDWLEIFQDRPAAE